MLDGAIIVDGKKHVLSQQTVRTWHDTGISFDEENGAEKRTEAVKAVVCHSTASIRKGDAGAQRLHDSLLARRTPLSVEFFVDEEGAIYQFMDPTELRGRHASRVNPFTVGIEVSGYLWAKPGRKLPKEMNRRKVYGSPPLAGNWKPNLFAYLPVQQRAVNRLCWTLCEALGLPKEVLGAPWERRPKGFFANWEGGVCGHIHCASLRVKHPKIDPGPRPLEYVERYFKLRAPSRG